MKSIKRMFLSFLFLTCAITAAFASELPIAPPEEVGMSPEKLEAVTQTMQRLVDEEKTAGVITVIARHGKVVYFKTAGFRDTETKKPMERDTICRFYSMTKPITSVAVMMLVEEGKVGLDEPVAKYLPELKGLRVFKSKTEDDIETVEPNRDVTVRDLLRHTSGFTYGIFGNTPVDQLYRNAGVLIAPEALDSMVGRIGKLPLLFHPGSRFNYSVSTDVLGCLVQAVSGMPLDKFFQTHIFDPLDMKDTAFYVPEDKLARFSACFGPDPDGGVRVTEKVETSRYRRMPKMLSGGGGLCSTARDYLRFCQMMLNKGELDGVRLLKPETVAMMTKDQLPKEAFPINLGGIPRPGVGFGLGFSVVVNAGARSVIPVGEYGWGGAASTHFWISPKDDLAVVVLTQHMPFNMQAEAAIKPLVYRAIVDRE